MKYWQTLMEGGVRHVALLQNQLHMTLEEAESLRQVEEIFPVFINPYYLSLIDPDDREDPIRKMCVPGMHELNWDGSFDTSGEGSNTVLPGLQHKYGPTALILTTNQCAMYCRHCFRKRLVGLSEEEICRHIPDIASYIRSRTQINNVLLSGGDAFMNSNETIERFLSALCGIPHLDLIRFGTRTPVVLPQRITSDPGLMDILHHFGSSKKIYVVTQFNHPREVTSQSAAAVEALQELDIPVLNQTVLLKGVNDDPAVLGDLLRSLTRIGVTPYYIFQCRPVTGVMHDFQVPLRRGFAIVKEALRVQNGLAKRVRYALSHETGKIEILGPLDDTRMLFRYHQARDEADAFRIFSREISKDQAWL